MIKKLFNNKYFVILLIVTLVLIIGMIFTLNKSYETKTSDNIIMRITMPFQKAVHAVSEKTREFFEHFGNIAELNRENQKLKTTVTQLEEKVQKNNMYKVENERLRAMLNIKDTYKDFFIHGLFHSRPQNITKSK